MLHEIPEKKQAERKKKYKIWLKEPIRPWKILLYIEWLLEHFYITQFNMTKNDEGFWVCYAKDSNNIEITKSITPTLAQGLKTCFLSIIHIFNPDTPYTKENMFAYFMKDLFDRLHISTDLGEHPNTYKGISEKRKEQLKKQKYSKAK